MLGDDYDDPRFLSPGAPRAAWVGVLVATDGSVQARAALATSRSVSVAGADTRAGHQRPAGSMGYRLSILLAALDRSANHAAAGARRALSRRWPDADVRIVDAAPVPGILREANRFEADVIVLGWRGHGATSNLLTGSVSRGVVRGATCAVLVVRKRPRDVRRVVIAYDGSTHAERAVEFVRTLTPPRGGRVTLFTAVDRMVVPSQALAPSSVRATVAAEVTRINVQRVERAKKALTRAVAALTRAGWRVQRAVTAGAPLRRPVGDRRLDRCQSRRGRRARRRRRPALLVGECRRRRREPVTGAGPRHRLDRQPDRRRRGRRRLAIRASWSPASPASSPAPCRWRRANMSPSVRSPIPNRPTCHGAQ